MRPSILIIATFAVLASCQNQDGKKTNAPAFAKDTANFTSIKWMDSLVNIGTIPAGKKAEIKFRFKNTGEKPLFIISAEPGCGCTVADYPKEAISPGAEGLITANYDVDAGSHGEFRKNIHVTTNTKGSTNHTVYFYGVIKNKADSVTSAKSDTTVGSDLNRKK